VFGFLKRIAGFFSGSSKSSQKQEASASAGSAVMGTILLESKDFSLEPAVERLSRLKTAGHQPQDVKLDPAGIIMCTVKDHIVALALMPAPVPGTDIPHAAKATWLWPKHDPIQKALDHKAFILCTLMGGTGTPVECRLILSQIMATVTDLPGVVGIYWHDAGVIHYPPVFTEMAQSDQAELMLPINIWTDIRVGNNNDGTSSGRTLGMTALGHMEIEYPKSPTRPSELREWLQHIVLYVLDAGPILKHGQTIGLTQDEKIKITHTNSVFGLPGKVIRLGD
jgi:hypothetical protein